jgi:hypothetical protein
MDDTKKPWVTELIFSAADPDSPNGQSLRIRVKGVSFDKIDVLKFTVGDIVKEELPFTFDSFEFLSTIRPV